jgi:hypothetical protein
MPLLSELATSVYRDLGDEGKVVFSPLQVEDFIRGGIAELNRVAPMEIIEDITLHVDPNGVIDQWDYDVPIGLPYGVEVRSVDGAVAGLGPGLHYSFRTTPRGGVIELNKFYLSSVDPALYTIRVRGYGPRPLPSSNGGQDPAVDVSPDEEYSVREFARAQGYDLLAHDRSLFGQWQGQTNNTDVSPTQMLQLASSAKAEWSRRRGLIRVVRRYE